MPWKFGAATDIGGRSEQQDRLAILHSPDNQRHLIVVADGMGGLQEGALAAQTLIDIAAQRFAEHHGNSAFDFLHNICLASHHAISDLAIDAESAPGTTALLLYLNKQTASWMHVGDSRLYHFRKDQLLSRTNDHSLLQIMLGKGQVEAGSAEAIAMQNKLYMRLGSKTIPEPDFNTSSVEDGDLFVLCSDGLWQVLQSDEIIEMLDQHPLDQDGPQYLADLARQRGGTNCDNISLALVQWDGCASSGYLQRFAKGLRNAMPFKS